MAEELKPSRLGYLTEDISDDEDEAPPLITRGPEQSEEDWARAQTKRELKDAKDVCVANFLLLQESVEKIDFTVLIYGYLTTPVFDPLRVKMSQIPLNTNLATVKRLAAAHLDDISAVDLTIHVDGIEMHDLHTLQTAGVHKQDELVVTCYDKSDPLATYGPLVDQSRKIELQQVRELTKIVKALRRQQEQPLVKPARKSVRPSSTAESAGAADSEKRAARKRSADSRDDPYSSDTQEYTPSAEKKARTE